ncbi:unnamed protein product [Brachionus calyciflorus]|uniref:Uncharacterized protein n=1 Tax=Brachionus calyciflorus TaxID=104777 RepID=A0A813RJ08_9BILA|nr:unnamed protein product [Brachionus calyciflorus]
MDRHNSLIFASLFNTDTVFNSTVSEQNQDFSMLPASNNFSERISKVEKLVNENYANNLLMLNEHIKANYDLNRKCLIQDLEIKKLRFELERTQKENFELRNELDICKNKLLEDIENINYHYDSVHTPITSNIPNNELDDSIVLTVDKPMDYETKGIVKSVSSPAIMTDIKTKYVSRFRKEFRLFNHKIEITQDRNSTTKSTSLNDFKTNEEIDRTKLGRSENRHSVLSLFRKVKKDSKPKSKRLSSSLSENLKVYDK